MGLVRMSHPCESSVYSGGYLFSFYGAVSTYKYVFIPLYGEGGVRLSFWGYLLLSTRFFLMG